MQRKKHERGIVLLEAIIAVGVLITVFSAISALYMTSINGLRITNDQLIATYLAQDGVEQIVAKRQYNHDNELNWLEGISHCISENPCSLDYLNVSLAEPMVPCIDSCFLYRDVNGEYSPNNTGKKTHFMRSVEINQFPGGIEAEVVVHIKWVDGSKILELPVVYVLYNKPSY
ncbi:MAG: hypothetical protein UV60_C0019G0018 [Parcubacteria group bacterium GW2011_GWA2_43_11]|nr:MAG: hypothetical protein UV60_C0019G0018 [Parcubacteria group bacterium GW2011_GWA2_43_11]